MTEPKIWLSADNEEEHKCFVLDDFNGHYHVVGKWELVDSRAKIHSAYYTGFKSCYAGTCRKCGEYIGYVLRESHLNYYPEDVTEIHITGYKGNNDE